jgi:hypothetical protein
MAMRNVYEVENEAANVEIPKIARPILNIFTLPMLSDILPKKIMKEARGMRKTMGISATSMKSRWNDTPMRGTANAIALERNGVMNAAIEVVVKTSHLEPE